MDKQLEEKLTAGGKVPLAPGINLEKLVAADKIIEGIGKGDNSAVAAFKDHLGARFSESVLTTGDDFIYAFTHLTALQVANDFEAAERTWAEAIETEVVASFDAPRVWGIDYQNVEGFGRPVSEPGKPDWVPPIVAEGSPYPQFKLSGEFAAAGAIHKAGGAFGLTFERIVSNPGEIVPALPGLITDFLLDREEWDAWNGLISFIDAPAQHLQGTTNYDGTVVPADAALSVASVVAALRQAKTAEINNRKVQVRGGYNLIVKTGRKEEVEFILGMYNWASRQVTSGTITDTFNVVGPNPLSDLRGIIETEFIGDDQWALIPVKGGVRGSSTRKFYSLGKLRGHEAPEVRVEDVAGIYSGGGKAGPFEGSFRTDSANLRGRIIGGPLGWNPEYAVISDGDGGNAVPPSV